MGEARGRACARGLASLLLKSSHPALLLLEAGTLVMLLSGGLSDVNLDVLLAGTPQVIDDRPVVMVAPSATDGAAAPWQATTVRSSSWF